MKILYVNDRLDRIWGGGTAERTRRLSAALVRQGHQVTILTTALGMDPDAIESFKADGVKLVTLKFLNKRFAIPVLPIGQLRRLVRAQDIVQLSQHWTLLNAVIYLLAKLEKKPYAVNPAGALPSFGRSKKLKSIYNWVVGFAMIRNADAHIAITPAEFEQFAAYGVVSEVISVIPNGVDQSAFNVVDTSEFRDKYALGDAKIILFMGRLNPIKGPDLLLDAFVKVAERLPEYIVVFAGPNEGMEQSLRQTAQMRGLAERVKFLGYVGGADKTAAYRAATMLVIPSRKEAMSIVVLEAGAAGTPVLITDQCGFDMVEEIGGGRVVQADAQHLADGLLDMLGGTVSLVEVGGKLCDLVRREFTWDAAAKKLQDVFLRVLAR